MRERDLRISYIPVFFFTLILTACSPESDTGSNSSQATTDNALETATPLAIDTDDIAGVATGAEGPEAGVWVIAETGEFETFFESSVANPSRTKTQITLITTIHI